MASASPVHGTLTANTVDNPTDQPAATFDLIEVAFVSGTDPIYVRVDGTDPGVAAAGSHVLPAAPGAWIKLSWEGQGVSGPVLKLKSAGASKWSARGLNS